MILVSLPDTARQSFQKPAEELRAVLEQRIRAFDSRDDEDHGGASDSGTPELIPEEPHQPATDPRPNTIRRAVWVAAGIGLIMVTLFLVLR